MTHRPIHLPIDRPIDRPIDLPIDRPTDDQLMDQLVEIFCEFDFDHLILFIDQYNISLQFIINQFKDIIFSEYNCWSFYKQVYRYVNQKDPILVQQMNITEKKLQLELAFLDTLFKSKDMTDYISLYEYLYPTILYDIRSMYTGSPKIWNEFKSRFYYIMNQLNRLQKPVFELTVNRQQYNTIMFQEKIKNDQIRTLERQINRERRISI